MEKNTIAAVAAFATGTIAIIVLLIYGNLIPDFTQGIMPFFKEAVSAIVPVVSFAVGTYYARKAFQFQQELASKKPELGVMINNSFLIPDSPRGIREIAFGYSLNKSNRVFCVIPFTIGNDGDVSASKVHVRLKFPANLSAHGITDIDTEKVLGDLEASGIRRKSYEYNDQWFVDYTIPEITPKTGVGFEELVDVTYSSAVDLKMDASDKDDVPLSVNVRLALLSKVKVSISSRDTKPLFNYFIIKSYDTTDDKEIAKRILKEREKAVLGGFKTSGEESKSEAKATELLRKAIIVVPKLNKLAGTKPSKQFTAVYVEDPRKSKRWIMDPARKIPES